MNFNLIWTVLIFQCGIFDTSSGQTSPNSVDYWLELIYEGFQKSAQHVFPSDASEYSAPEAPVIEHGNYYDFVIIGAGVSGCALANRLSEGGRWNILVIEAGKFVDNGIVKIPAMFGINLFSDYNWGFRTEPQKNACQSTTDKTCRCPRGKGVGGTSTINSLQYVRANPIDFNQWAKTLQDESWSYKNMLKYFKKSENFHWTNPKAPVSLKYHGLEGLLHVQHRVPDHPLNDIFLGANKDAGYKIIDYNSLHQKGASIIQIYTKNGTREDMGTVYITPFLNNRPNLEVLTESYATQIEIDPITKEAKSVLFTNNGITYRARASKEVLLCAGAISSPQILMLSGIGPKTHLENLDIPVVADLEVGSYLTDHALASYFFFSSNLTIPAEPLEQQVAEFIQGLGPLTVSSTQCQGIGFYNVNCPNRKVPDTVIFSDNLQINPMEQKFEGLSNETYLALSEKTIANCIRFFLLLLDPKSHGTLRLKSKNPFDYPLIDPRLLSDKYGHDIETMYKGILQIFKLAATPTYKKIDLKYAGEPLPACKQHKFLSRAYWYCFLRQGTFTGYHPMCTCPMSTNKFRGVVDSKFKVFEVNKLRVCDASVFPFPIHGYPSINCLAIAQKLSDDINNEYL